MVSWPSFSVSVILPIRVSIRFMRSAALRLFDSSIRATDGQVPDNGRPLCASRSQRMILERPGAGASPLLDPEEIAQSGLGPQMGMVGRALWAAPVRNALLALSAALFLVIVATAYGQI